MTATNTNIQIWTSEYRCPDLKSDGVFRELDLGCGKGGFTCELAVKYPEREILAADVMLGRLRKLRNKIQGLKLQNVFLLRAEAWQLFGYMLPDASINRIHVICPDPWPKLRHRGRRLISSEFIGRVGRVLSAAGVFHFATDDRNYFDSVTRSVAESNIFLRDDSKIADVLELKSDFERKWQKQGCAVRHAAWSKI